MTGTDKDHTGIDSRSLASFCYANSAVLHLFMAIMEKWSKKYRLLVEQCALFGEILTK
jgi:hypothetical protein